MVFTSARPAKRRRIEQYRRGSVIRVEVRNFMTYAHAVIEPGPRLNLILGPNGTGKSSFVCALCVGLAGSTRLLGRADDLSSFVRRGTDRGEVEITLASDDPGKPHRIKRRIYASKNSSEWWIDGRQALQRDVNELTEKLNIQLDNLCQFLPQEKVGDFAKMKPVELLAATEAAIGDASLAAMHARLVQVRGALTEHETAVSHISTELDRLKKENEQTERSVHQIRHRDKLLAEAEDMRKKVPWAEHALAKTEWLTEKTELKEVENKLNAMRSRQEDDDGPLNEKKKTLEAVTKADKQSRLALERAISRTGASLAGGSGGRRSAGSASANAGGLQDLVDDLAAQVGEKQEEINGLEGKSQARLAKIDKAKQDIERLLQEEEQWAAQATCDAAMQAQKERVQAEIRDLGNQEVAMQQDREEHSVAKDAAQTNVKRVQDQLRRLSDHRQQRLRILEQRNRNITKAWHWIQHNRNRFRGVVLGPLAVEVEVPNPVHAAMLEQHVTGSWWTHFVVEHQDDQDLLRTELQQQCEYRATISCYGGDPSAPLHYPLGRSNDLARFGVTGTLDEVFQAQPVIKHVLNDNFFITSSFVMKSAEDDWEGLFAAEPRAQVVWTPENQIRRRVSQYNKAAVSTMVTPLRPATLLMTATAMGGTGTTIDVNAERARLEEELRSHQADVERCDAAYAALQPGLNDVAERKKKAMTELQRLNGLRTQALSRQRAVMRSRAIKEAQLNALESEPDPLTRRPALEKELNGLLQRAYEAAERLADAYCRLPEAFVAYAATDLSVKELKDQVERMQTARREREQRLREIQDMVDSYRANVTRLKDAVARRLSEAKEATGWPIPPDVEARLEQLPSDPAQLRLMAQSKADEADGVLISDPGALERYHKRCEDIARSETELAAAQERRELAVAEAEDLKGRWVPELKRLVGIVNESFAKSFPLVGCAGEVALVEAPDDDFANYAIEIRVKFREEEPLATLDANRQSGGERSVSTMLYINALQGVAASPFRVVDEINQGMDQNNERKVFALLAQAATEPDTPQCFLLTPKLLPELPFSPDVTVLQIMNGVHVRDVAQGFYLDKLLGQRRLDMLQSVAA